MKNPFRTRYKVVTDNYLGYEIRVKKWYFPFWYQYDFTNTFSTLEEAVNLVKNLQKVHYKSN